jgi:hypothetical protein
MVIFVCFAKRTVIPVRRNLERAQIATPAIEKSFPAA